MPFPPLPRLRSQVVAISRRLHENGWVANHDGNASVRLNGNRLLITSSSISKRDVDDASLLVVDMGGNVLEGRGRPFSELDLHLAAYRTRPEIDAVLHAHPPFATAFGLVEQELSPIAIPATARSPSERTFPRHCSGWSWSSTTRRSSTPPELSVLRRHSRRATSRNCSKPGRRRDLARASNRAALPATVVVLGLVSLLTDLSSEMIFPLLPAFLAARFPDAPLLLGAMEGLAELVAAIFKWLSGQWVDRAKRLRPLVICGYAIATAARPLMAFASSWWQPLLIRATDRVGKGIRGSPRDAMISSWVPEGGRGRAYGFQRAMDNGGAALGALAAAALVGMGIQVERVFLLSAIPGALALLVLFFAGEPESRVVVSPGRQALEPVPRRLFAYLGPVALFGLANSTDAFLLLKLTAEGAPARLLPLAWLMLQAVKSIVSFPAGWVADRMGSAWVVAAGWGLYAVSYLGLALVHGVPATLAVIAFYGLYHGLSEGAERALLSSLAPAQSRGRAFGLYYALSGISALAAGLGFGAIWKWFGQPAAFFSAAAIAGVSTLLFVALLPVARRGVQGP